MFYVYYVKPFGSCQISCSGCSLPTYMISSQVWCSLICSYYICAVSPRIFNDLRLFWVRPTRLTGKSLYYIAASIWSVRRNRSQHQSCRKVLQSILFIDCGRILQDSISLTEDELWRGLNKLMERMPWDTKYDELDWGHFTTSKRCECDTQLTLSS